MSDDSKIRLLKINYIKLKSFLFSKNALSFLLFFALSSGFWFMNALDKVRETNISIPLRFVGLEKNITITNDLPDEVNVIVKDQGVNLLSYSRYNIQEIVFDVNSTFYEKGRIRISSDQIRGKLSRFLLSSTSIVEIKPDSLVLRYEKLSSKILPIELNAAIDFKQQYVLSEKIQLRPEEITVFGPRRVLNSLTSVKTEKIILTEVDDSVSLTAKLMPIENVTFASNETRLSMNVEMFTEKKLELPVKVINCPENTLVRTFPAKVNVSFNVGLSHFNDLDYEEITQSNQSKHSLKLSTVNSYISNFKISPSEVEYIIEVL